MNRNDMEWLPIETAPSENIDILVFCSDSKEQFVAFSIGNRLYQFASTNDVQVVCEPNYWMPLPPPPKGEE